MVYTRRAAPPATPRPPSVLSEDDGSPASDGSSPEGPALALAAGLVENLTPVVPRLGPVVGPSDEPRVESGGLLSPVRTPRGRTRERSAGSAISPLPAAKKAKGKQRAGPLATTSDYNWFPPASPRPTSVQPSPGLTLRVPGGRVPGQASSLPPASSFALEALAAFNRLTAGLNLQDPLVRSQVRHAFREHAQWLDVEALLAPPAPALPAAPPGFPPLPSALPGEFSPPSRFVLPHICALVVVFCPLPGAYSHPTPPPLVLSPVTGSSPPLVSWHVPHALLVSASPGLPLCLPRLTVSPQCSVLCLYLPPARPSRALVLPFRLWALGPQRPRLPACCLRLLFSSMAIPCRRLKPWLLPFATTGSFTFPSPPYLPRSSLP